MNIDFELTMQDYIDFNFNYMDTSKSMKHMKLIQYILLTLLFLATMLHDIIVKRRSIWFSVCIYTVLIILWVKFNDKIIKKLMKPIIVKAVKEGKKTNVLGNHNLTLDEDGIVYRTEFSETKYKRIEKIVETDNHIFVYVNTVTACIIPKRVFINIEDKDKFLNMLND